MAVVTHDSEPPPPRRLLALLQLVRLPNVFTAAADIFLGYLLVRPNLQPPLVFALLLGASLCLYMAGMALNDVCDVEQDARERPQRPIPSGRIGLPVARAIGWGLLLAGAGCGWAANAQTGSLASGLFASALALCVLLYDRWLKRTPLGPLAMGACRSLNVLLGASAGGWPFSPAVWLAALGLGLYIAGVTWFARKEAGRSGRGQLSGALCVIFVGIATLAAQPAAAEQLAQRWPLGELPQYALAFAGRWYVVWLLLAASLLWRFGTAVRDPQPRNVQRAVRNGIWSLVVLDAMLVFAMRGPQWAWLVLLLLLPTMFLGRWVYST